VAFGGTSENPQGPSRTLQKVLEPQRAWYIRFALLIDSFLLHQIHHCLPCTYGQSIAPLQALRQLKATLKPILSCACEEGICGEMCACANPNEQRVAGCTIWCHPDATDPRNPSTRCKHLAVTPLTGPVRPTVTSTLELVGRAPKVQAEQRVGRKRKKA
jgi:hypothetical protein